MTATDWASSSRRTVRLAAATLAAAAAVVVGATLTPTPAQAAAAPAAHAAAPAAAPHGAAPRNAAAPAVSAYTAMTSQRLLDTRPAPDGSNQSLPAGDRIGLTVIGGATGVPVAATAVVLNVTSVNNQGSGYLQVFPAGTQVATSAGNYYFSGELTQNLVTVQTPGDGTGQIFIRTSAAADVLVDEQGYFTAPSGTAGQYVPLTPARITDTRAGSGQANAGHTQGSGGVLHLQVTGTGGVPSSGVAAAVLNVTVADDPVAGFVQAYPDGTPRPIAPPTSSVDYNGNQPVFGGPQFVSNRVVVPVGSNGQVSLFTSSGPIDLIVDVNGYFTDASGTPPPPPAAGHTFTPVIPARIADTRTTSAIPAGGTLTLQVAGSGGISVAASAAVLNVTVDKTSEAATGPGSGFITIFPGSTGPPPLASDINFGPNSIVPAEVYATLNSTGQVSIFNGSPSPVDVVVDAYGYFN